MIGFASGRREVTGVSAVDRRQAESPADASRPAEGGTGRYRPYGFDLRFLPAPLAVAKDFVVSQVSRLSDVLAETPVVSAAWNRVLCSASTAEIRRAGMAFIHIPKTCGTSISMVLYGRNLPHYTARFYAENAPADLLALPSFAVIRDPIERVISAWRFVRGRGTEEMAYNLYDRSRLRGLERFDDFVSFLGDSDMAELPRTFWPQTDFITGAEGEILVNRLFAFRSSEGLPESLVEWIGRPVPHLNVSQPFEARPSARSLDILSRCYGEDLALFERLLGLGGAVALTGTRA